MPSTEIERTQWSEIAQQMRAFDASAISKRVAFRNALSVALALMIGQRIGGPPIAALMAVGATTSAMMDDAAPLSVRFPRLLLGGATVTLSTFVSAITGASATMYLAALIPWSFASGLLLALGSQAEMLGVVSMVDFIVMSRFAQDLSHAMLTAFAVFCGALVMIVFSILIPGPGKFPQAPRTTLSQALATLREHLTPHSSTFRHAVRLTVCVALLEILISATHLPRGYWAPMTAALVLKPGLSRTIARTFLRVLGTITASALVVTFDMAGLTHEPARMLLIFIAIFFMRSIGRAHYGLLSAAVTVFVIELLAIVSEPPHTSIEERTIATLIGGATALAFTWRRGKIQDA